MNLARWPVVLGAALAATPALAEDNAAGWGDLSDFQVHRSVFDTKVYGFIDSYWEKVAETPAGVDEAGRTVWEENPGEFDVANFNVMVQGSIHDKYRYFINLAAPGAGSATDDEPIGVRNAWVEAPIAGQFLAVRFGKLYRRFGLYNEMLDATPTFMGIEPPELFDKDHLLVTRTTNLMLHGSLPIGGNTLVYSVATGNDEKAGDAIPLSADVHFDAGGSVKIGTSYYTTNGTAEPSRGMGDGSPRGGVVNWMSEDDYQIYGGYAEVNAGGLKVQGEYWAAPHQAVRDDEALASLADAGLNNRQMSRYFVNGDPEAGTRGGPVSYVVQTWYGRAGYTIPIKDKASVMPYGQIDYYSNPETIAEKDFGGDAEAGLSDDGQFFKYTVGSVIRPVPQVALKLDGSAHAHLYNGEPVIYPEVRVSLSYLWQLAD